jgi:hypothetical protein
VGDIVMQAIKKRNSLKKFSVVNAQMSTPTDYHFQSARTAHQNSCHVINAPEIDLNRENPRRERTTTLGQSITKMSDVPGQGFACASKGQGSRDRDDASSTASQANQKLTYNELNSKL